MDSKIKLKELPKNERPRERLSIYGKESLSSAELLAIVLKTGTKEEGIMEMSNRLLKESGGLDSLFNLTFEELISFKGIGEAKASQILAFSELMLRVESYKTRNKMKITSAEEIFTLFSKEMSVLNYELIKIILLDTKNFVIKIKDISKGTLNSSLIHPREVFNEAIRASANSIILCHNHPSGDSTPSGDDINITKRLKEASEIIGIKLLDHIIIGKGNYTSLSKIGIL